MKQGRADAVVKIDPLIPTSIERPDDAFAKALIERTGLNRYRAIMQFKGDVSNEASGFQRLFNGYYNVRCSEEWRRSYYALFQEVRMAKEASYECILREFHNRTGRVEPSFASKMLATIDDSQPIWDRRVISALKRFDSTFPVIFTDAVNGNIDKALEGYQALAGICRYLLEQPIGQTCIDRFDFWLGDFSDISDTKKLDVVLWCAGS